MNRFSIRARTATFHIEKIVSCFVHTLGSPLSELFGSPLCDANMNLVEADLGSWCASEHGTQLVSSHALFLHWRAGPSRCFDAIRKETGLFCGSFLEQGEVFAYAGLNQTPKDLKVEGLDCNPKGSRDFVRIFVTKGRGVRLEWVLFKPKELQGEGEVLAFLFMLGAFKP